MTRDEMREQLKKLNDWELFQRAIADVKLLRDYPDDRSLAIADATEAECLRRRKMALWLAAKAMVVEEEQEKRRKERELLARLPGQARK